MAHPKYCPKEDKTSYKATRKEVKRNGTLRQEQEKLFRNVIAVETPQLSGLVSNSGCSGTLIPMSCCYYWDIRDNPLFMHCGRTSLASRVSCYLLSSHSLAVIKSMTATSENKRWCGNSAVPTSALSCHPSTLRQSLANRPPLMVLMLPCLSVSPTLGAFI